ncbi:helix-turn-helix domain-containing protein [Pseudonocardia sp. GCM10023141]|uniref:AraC-like ligand-binding domain-containing protein n=1 Tax=Pseudonocardia sp. GCM10023141 TaxID=3252653 RepID=UPI00360AA5A5
MAMWDITERPAQEQFDFWREVICQAFVPLAPTRTSAGEPGFAARVETRTLGSINRADIRSQPQLTSHGPREVSRSQGAFYFVNLQLAGRCAVRNGGTESVVAPGQFTVLDTTEPYYLGFDTEWRMLSYRIPHEQLSRRLPDPGRGTGHPVDGAAGLGGVVTALMRSLWELDDGTATSALIELEQSFAAVVAVALGGEQQRDPRHRDQRALHDGTRAAILRHVDAHLGDPALSVASVCRAFSISPRLLHTLFETQEQSFAETVRALRLDRCARMLADPRQTATITEVAARNGYPDPAAFSRAFRRRFGTAPSELRPRPSR